MKSYTTGRNLAGVWTKNTATAHLTYLDQIANDDYRALLALRDWPFLERSRTLSTTANTQFTTLPYDCDLVREISVIPTGSTTRYTPTEVTSRAEWDRLNLSTFTSDMPEYYFIQAGQVGLWPTPTSTGNTIYVQQKTRVIDLSVADATVTVTTATNGGTGITVSSGLTTLQAGLWLRIPYSGAANTGDGQWYEISSVTNSTTLVLVRAYGGTSISAGSVSSTIAQMPLLPEAFHDLPWMWSAGDYWSKEDDKRAKRFFDDHGHAAQGNLPATGRVKDLIAGYSSATTNMVIDEGMDREIINPNLTVSL